MSYYSEEEFEEFEEFEDAYSDVEYERKCAESTDLIDFYSEVIVDGVRYDADGDVIMLMV